MVEILNNYEVIFIVNSSYEEEKLNAVIEKFRSLISENGEITKEDIWGKRRLAYPIDDYTEGYYVLFEFTSNPAFPKELERVFKITEGILRNLVVRKTVGKKIV